MSMCMCVRGACVAVHGWCMHSAIGTCVAERSSSPSGTGTPAAAATALACALSVMSAMHSAEQPTCSSHRAAGLRRCEVCRAHEGAQAGYSGSCCVGQPSGPQASSR
eukprot:scaffold32899_cov68-Phaeocystis_antarctica.AAC.2